MRWNTKVVKRPVPEPDRLRAEALRLKGQSDALLRKADSLLMEAEKLEAAENAKESR